MKPKNLLDDITAFALFEKLGEKFPTESPEPFLTTIQMNALATLHGLPRGEFISEVRFTFSHWAPAGSFFLLALRFSPARAPNRTFSRTKTFPINYGPLAGASARYLISYLSPWIDLKYVFQTCGALILLDVETFSIHCWDLDEKYES